MGKMHSRYERIDTSAVVEQIKCIVSRVPLYLSVVIMCWTDESNTVTVSCAATKSNLCDNRKPMKT